MNEEYGFTFDCRRKVFRRVVVVVVGCGGDVADVGVVVGGGRGVVAADVYVVVLGGGGVDFGVVVTDVYVVEANMQIKTPQIPRETSSIGDSSTSIVRFRKPRKKTTIQSF